MSLLAAVLLLWGETSWDPTAEAFLWADAQSLQEPWANLTLTCQAAFPTKDFQLILNGWRQHRVHLNKHAMSHQFPLGAITSENKGVYRCRCGVEPLTLTVTELNKWTMLSNLVEVTGTEPLPAPSLLADPVSWITPHVATYLLCHSAMRGVTFLLSKEEDDNFLRVRKAQDNVVARFVVRHPGNYRCSYRTHAEGTPSEPSETVTITKYVKPPKPLMAFLGTYQRIQDPSSNAVLACKAPRNVFEFQLRQDEKILNIREVRPLREVSLYYLNLTEMSNQRPLTCRYRLHRMLHTWSEDSEPKELMWSDETQPAPVLTAEPSSHDLEPGSTLHLRCTAPKAGLRFGLLRQGDTDYPVIKILNPSGTEAVFELHNISTIDSGNYSCVYMEQEPPFSGSAPSEVLELLVNGPPPKPKLEALWKGIVPLGREANFRCHGHVGMVNIELLREGFHTPMWMNQAIKSTTADLKLPFVGPQHSGNYSCRYTAMSPFKFESDFSNPVELIVERLRSRPGAQSRIYNPVPPAPALVARPARAGAADPGKPSYLLLLSSSCSTFREICVRAYSSEREQALPPAPSSILGALRSRAGQEGEKCVLPRCLASSRSALGEEALRSPHLQTRPRSLRGFYVWASESAQVIRTPGQKRGGGVGKLQQGLVAGLAGKARAEAVGAADAMGFGRGQVMAGVGESWSGHISNNRDLRGGETRGSSLPRLPLKWLQVALAPAPGPVPMTLLVVSLSPLAVL
ncbi:alpha-1B-glycoprotein [Onychomys torridus]|uniref:alpha-1B-glycoprotein n=1 Tax=Onychomys torridus TaxID=38674 RepID=UPI00167FCBFB|nr:alpha-1B-glycoprotein [Onychomys torridus]